MTYDDWVKEVENRIERNEGRSAVRYKDSRGIWTTGIGLNLTRPDADAILRRAGSSLAAVNAGATLTDAQIDNIFQQCLVPVMASAATSIVGYEQLSDARRFVIVDMIFNLGYEGWMEFTGTRSLIEQGIAAKTPNMKSACFGAAADHMEATPWYQQVGQRAVDDCAMMRSSVWV